MLDGKYEITSERELSPRETLFGAVAPDGARLQISWYTLRSTAEEEAFERYRACLRRLRREGYAAIYDLVARPGAHYVAWRLPERPLPPHSDLGALEALLRGCGHTLADARLGSDEHGAPRLYGLAFGDAPTPALPEAPPAASARPAAPPSAGRWVALATTAWAGFRPWALGSVLTLSGILLLVLSMTRFLQSDLVDVPDVRGQEVNTALRTLYHAGFSTAPVPLRSAERAGVVLELSPPPGTPLRPGRTLSVRYALPAGRAPEAVPAVNGLPLARAEAALEAAGFVPGEVARAPSSAQVGTVIAQAPAATTPATQGSAVRLLVSDGPRVPRTFVPELTGLSLDDALSLAEAAGFARETVQLERTPGVGVAAGTVLAQNIAPFVAVPQGQAQLRLLVAESSATPPDEGGTPDLIGLGLAEAQRRARAAGLSVLTEGRVSTSELPTGVVMQRPPPGGARQGSVRVTLNVPPLPLPEAQATVSEGALPVRRARYAWQLGPDAAGQLATVTVEAASGERETVVRAQRVGADARVTGSYLTTARGPLTFRLSVSGAPYGAPLTVDP